jgi:uncharacterized protein with NRDE domain
MCVAALAWCAHPRWRLVAIGNRDEFHERPAAALGQWDGAGGLIAGRDLRSGGTWLGVSPGTARFALVTNLRGFGDPDPARVSRGELVIDLLSARGRYADPDKAALDDFNPFNLLLATATSLRFLTNRPGPIRTALAPGIYGLSNGTLDEPWPKTLALKAALLGWLTAGAESPEALFAALASESLPDTGLHPAAPSDIPAEPRETPPFIRNAIYGTRCSTVTAIGHDGKGCILERRFSADARPSGETRIAFEWQVPPQSPV